MSSFSWKSLAALAACSLVLVGSASAQVCGDADGNGSVTVTDGVQTLRAAAGLSSSCTAIACDVDGNGSVTVTDGVNVLRKAAGVTIAESCPGGRDAQLASLLGSTLPAFGGLTKFSAGSASASARAAQVFQQACDNQDGSFTFDDQTGEFTFTNCNLEGFRYDGFLTISGDTLDFDLTFTDLSTGEFEALSGSLSARAAAQNVVFAGFFNLDSSLGTFSVGFDDLVVDPNSTGIGFVGGALEFSVDQAQLPDVDTIRLNFDTSNIALVEVNLTDGSVVPFNYDLVSGALTPIAN